MTFLNILKQFRNRLNKIRLEDMSKDRQEVLNELIGIRSVVLDLEAVVTRLEKRAITYGATNEEQENIKLGKEIRRINQR